MDVLMSTLLVVVLVCSLASLVLSMRERRKQRAYLQQTRVRLDALVTRLEELVQQAPTDKRR